MISKDTISETACLGERPGELLHGEDLEQDRGQPGRVRQPRHAQVLGWGGLVERSDEQRRAPEATDVRGQLDFPTITDDDTSDGARLEGLHRTV
jgi:hypothetical protein